MKLQTITLCSATLGEEGKTEPPLGPLYVAAAFESCGCTVDFRDYQLAADASSFDASRLVTFLRDHARHLAISCFVDMLPVVIEGTRQLHAEDPELRVILGGPGPTAAAARIVTQYPWIHAVVRGEGEETIEDWIRAEREDSPRAVPGMVRRYREGILDGGERARIRDLAQLRSPAYGLLDWSHYSHARVVTTRGCAYRCSFCDVTALWGNRSTFRPLDGVFEEMEMLHAQYGKSRIAVIDDTFVLNRERVRRFCRGLMERRSGIEWGCFGRINLMSRDIIELMREAGCRAIFYGIDSGSQYILDATIKRIHRQDILPCLKWSADAFEKVEASFIWGYPFEEFDHFRATLDLAAEASLLAPTVNVQLHMLSPLPMSPIYRGFKGALEEPVLEDGPWLLLPPLLLDDRARALQLYLRQAPDIFPGFFSFPTPCKQRKRNLLERSMRRLDRTIGRTCFDRDIAGLLEAENRRLELTLLRNARHPSDRIGTGLALGLFRRARRRAAFRGGEPDANSIPGAALRRRRNEEMAQTHV